MSKNIYDLEDWKQGNIPRPKEIEGDQEKDSLVYWTFEYNTPRITESEFKKIRALQKEVFFELIDLKVEALKRKFFNDLHFVLSSQAERKDIYHLEFRSLQEKLDDPYLLKRMKLKKWDRTVVTSEVYQTYNNYKSIKEEIDTAKLEIGENIFASTDLMFKEARLNKPLRRFSEIDLNGLFGTYVNYRYLTNLKKEYVAEFEDDLRLPVIEDSIVQEEHVQYGSIDINVDKLKRILKSGDSITEGKIKFIRYIQNKFDLRTDKMAFEKASEIFSDLHNGHNKLYKNLASYQSTKSQYYNS